MHGPVSTELAVAIELQNTSDPSIGAEIEPLVEHHLST